MHRPRICMDKNSKDFGTFLCACGERHIAKEFEATVAKRKQITSRGTPPSQSQATDAYKTVTRPKPKAPPPPIYARFSYTLQPRDISQQEAALRPDDPVNLQDLIKGTTALMSRSAGLPTLANLQGAERKSSYNRLMSERFQQHEYFAMHRQLHDKGLTDAGPCLRTRKGMEMSTYWSPILEGKAWFMDTNGFFVRAP